MNQPVNQQYTSNDSSEGRGASSDGFNVSLLPKNFFGMRISSYKSLDEIIDVVKFVAYYSGYKYLTESEYIEGRKNKNLPADYCGCLPYCGTWELSTNKREFKTRIFLEPNGQEGVPDKFTVEVSCSSDESRYFSSEFYNNLTKEVTYGSLTEQVLLGDLYENEQKQIKDGVEGAKATIERYDAIDNPGLLESHPKFIYGKIKDSE